MLLQRPVRRSFTVLASLLLAGGLTACGSDDDGGGGGTGATFDTPAAISAYLEGKTLTMEGDSIPSHPNGYDENTNFGNATQCYSSVTMTPTSSSWHVMSVLGTLENAPAAGDTGTCNHDVPGAELMFDSTAILIENVTPDCFDFTATYVGFGQEGRARITETSLSLEIFFKGQATGHRCADGAIGAQTVTLSGAPFTGDAVQQYTIQ
ncbi:MAG: hypothetical protein IT372_01640 [Polyangiaceae bacterium]|nr:hypothetical protein [Polyangiaceae bacterium]